MLISVEIFQKQFTLKIKKTRTKVYCFPLPCNCHMGGTWLFTGTVGAYVTETLENCTQYHQEQQMDLSAVLLKMVNISPGTFISCLRQNFTVETVRFLFT